MTSRDMLMLAKQGDPKIIATLLNHVIHPKGIKAQVAKRDECLHILVESDRKLNQQAVVSFIQSSIKTLQAESIAAIRIYGRQTGQKSFDWNQEIRLSWDYTAPDRPNIPVSSSPELINSEPARSTLETDSETIIPISDPILDLAPLDLDPSSKNVATHSSTPPITPESSLLSSADANPPVEPSMSEPAFEATTFAENELEQLPQLDLPTQDGAIDAIDATNGSDILRRPEAVILLIFVSMIMLWQMYLDLVDEPDADAPLTGRELARRLGVNNSTISRRKDRDNFPVWTQDLDPEGIAWVHQDGFFVPVEV